MVLGKQEKGPLGQLVSPKHCLWSCHQLRLELAPKVGTWPQEGQSILVMKVAKVGLCSMGPSGKGAVNVLEMLVAGEPIGSSFSANF